MVVGDRHEGLHQCLNSVKSLCDEIIIVDVGSSGKTKRTVQEFTNKIFDFKEINNLAAAKNLAFSHATMDYILWLDADEYLLEEDQLKFKELKKYLNTTIDAVSMICPMEFDEYGNPSLIYTSNRIVKRGNHVKWKGTFNEYLEVSGTIYRSDVTIRKSDNTTPSQNDQSLLIYEHRLMNGEIFSPTDLYYYANALKAHSRLRKAIMYYKEFLNTQKGWVEDQIQACINMAECYKELGEVIKEKESLVMSFIYDTPRPEVSCRLGDLQKEKGEYKKAIIWYCLALEKDLESTDGIRKIDYSTWYPHLQLCFCYWQIGEKKKSVEHNNKAKVYKPNDSQVMYNDQFFKEYFSHK